MEAQQESFFTRAGEETSEVAPTGAQKQEAVAPVTQPTEVVSAPETPEPPKTIEQIAEESGISVFEAKRRQTQSERDRYKAAAEKYEQELNALRNQQPDPEIDAARQLLELAKADEAFRQHLSSFDFDGNGRQVQPTTQAPADLAIGDLPQRPTPPEKPAGYSDYDAYQDMESASWKHRMEVEAYKDADREWLASRLDREDQMREAAIMQQQATIQRQMELDKIATRAVTQYGVPQDQLKDYRQAIGALTPEQEEQAFAYWWANQKRPNAEQLLARQKTEALARDKELREKAYPGALASQPPPVATPEQDGFFQRTPGARSLTS
jgi:hypothetical protein